MLELLFITFSLIRQYWIPTTAMVGSLGSWIYFSDTKLVPEAEWVRTIQEAMYHMKYHPYSREVTQAIGVDDFSEEIYDFSMVLRENEGEKRMNAIKALGMLEQHSAGALPTLLWTLYDKDPKVRNAALESIDAIIRLLDPVIIRELTTIITPLLISLLKHPDENVKVKVRQLLDTKTSKKIFDQFKRINRGISN